MQAFPAETIRAAFAKHRTVRAVAIVLHVAERTLFRWLRADPSLARAEIDRAGPGRVRRLPSGATRNVARSVGDRRAVALGALADGATVPEAARAAGVHERTVQRWRRALQ